MSASLHPPFAQSLRFGPRAAAQAQSANYCQGEDIRLHLKMRGHDGRPCLIVNDCLGGRWGEELRLELTEAEAFSPGIEVAFTGGGMLVRLAGGTPVPFRPGVAPPPSLVPRHGPDISVCAADVPPPAQEPAGAEPEEPLARGCAGRDFVFWFSAPVGMCITRCLPTPGGLLLLGSLDDPNSAVASIRLRQGERTWPLRPGAWTATTADGNRGFVACAPMTALLGTQGLDDAWLEVTLTTAESGTVAMPLSPPLPEAEEIPALRALLAEVGDLPDATLDQAFGEVLGPALVALNRQRLARPMAVEEHSFGPPVVTPRASLVIPLHGRLDMLPVQMALFTACCMDADEVIFVLDDPPRRKAALAAAQSAWARFGMPLRLILPAQSRGFGPASNLGLRHARGGVVVFLNADVFPQGTDWLDLLVAAVAQPGVGAAGARLLYPDGSLQHGGMRLEPGAGGWLFPEHPGKGLRPPPPAPGPREVEALTGACLALRREVAEQFGGFDPDYVIGDFEDADLSARLTKAGLRCVMEDRATLVHLERQSQGRADAQAGRWNLTLLNAWSYRRKREGA